MSKRCERCGRFIASDVALCASCFSLEQASKIKPLAPDPLSTYYLTRQHQQAMQAARSEAHRIQHQNNQLQEDAMKQEVKAGQTRFNEERRFAYLVIGQSQHSSAWITEHTKGERLGKFSEKAILGDTLIKDERGDLEGQEPALFPLICEECGTEFEAPSLDADPSKYCPKCADNLVTCRYCGRDFEKTEGACGRCHNVKLKCIICGKDFEGPPAACGQCYGQQVIKLQDAEDRIAYLKAEAKPGGVCRECGKFFAFSERSRANIYAHLCNACADRLNASVKKAQEAEQPEEVETEVRLHPFSRYLEMKTPGGLFVGGQQGYGFQGWTCVGFRFKESPEKIIAPNPVAWADTLGVLNQFGAHAKYKPVIATKAVWRKLGS